eukprot:Sspe_Gene.88347::Locus_60383_Transcript_1_1_Confidence_1.000_Length_1431::g.88347::m.88347
MGRGLTRSRSKTRLTSKEKRGHARKRSLSKLGDKLARGDVDFADSEDEYEEEEFEIEEESIENGDVVQKYRMAAKFAQQGLEAVLEKCAHGAMVAELCKLGDETIGKLCSEVFRKKGADSEKVYRGVAFPTNISINDVTANFAPVDGEAMLCTGDVVKIHCGAHVDGYVSQVAHTIIVDSNIPSSHPAASDVITAAHTAATAALHLMRPDQENINDAVTEMIGRVAADFKVVPCEGVLSHRVRRWTINTPICIINAKVIKDDAFQDVEPYAFGPHQVWHLDITMSTGHRQLHRAESETTIFQRNQVLLAPRIKAAHYVLKFIRDQFLNFPFNVRDFDNAPRARLGLQDLVKNDMVDPQHPMKTKSKEVTARFLWTVMLTPSGVERITGLPLQTNLTPANILTDPTTRVMLRGSLKNPESAAVQRKVRAKVKRAKKDGDAMEE